MGPALMFIAIAMASAGFWRFLDAPARPRHTAAAEIELSPPAPTPASALTAAVAIHGKLPFEPRVPSAAAFTLKTLEHDEWTQIEVAPGDNLSLIFSRLKLSGVDLHGLVSAGPDARALRELRPGQTLRLKLKDNRVVELVLELDQLNSLRVARDGEVFSAHVESVEPEVRLSAATTAITQSLFVDGQRAGLSGALIMRLTDIFGWDIDFALDLRPRDHFSVIFEEIYKDGVLVKQDRVLAAEFVNRGRRLRAVLYTSDDGRTAYYSEQGEAMRKAFLRTPVDFTRISSGFNLARRHPVLNTIRAHRGVDYAAPTGTPVRATADGKIRSLGTSGGYGRVVELQHGDTYSTLYAHLSRFARGVKQGGSVEQGQIIGYVGRTGLATGPHLHYEFRIKGVHRNPLTVELPKALALEQRYLTNFRQHAAPLLNQLDQLVARHEQTRATYVAQLNEPALFPMSGGRHVAN